MFGGFGTGTLSFITPETRLVGWGKLARINDEAEAIVKVLGAGKEGGALHDVSLSGLADALTPTTGLKDSGTSGDFAIAVRGALDAAEKAAGGRLKVRTRKNPRRAQDPSKAFEEGGTSTGYGVYGHGGGEEPMGASWRDTEFGSIIDQVLDLHESGDIGTDQVEKAWEFLMRMPASVHDPKGGSTGATRADHFLYDTLPIYGYDAVQRHGGVVSVSNRAALMVLDHPVTGDEITKIIETLAKEGRLDQARLRELIPDYGRYQ
jgi:hypothetical protein